MEPNTVENEDSRETELPSYPTSRGEHIAGFFNWGYRNLFFGLIATLMSLISYLLVTPSPPIDEKQIIIGLAILSATICMTNTAFSAELRAFLKKQQELVSNIAVVIAIVVIIVAAVVTLNSRIDETIATTVVTVLFLVSIGLGYYSHNIELKSRTSYVEALISEMRERDRAEYTSERREEQQKMIEAASQSTAVGDLKI